MKKIILISGLVVALSLSSYARRTVAEGETHSALGDYKIQVDDKTLTINGKEHIPYVISYENSDVEVRVAIEMDKKCKKYYVISDNLSVQYVCNRKYFGVEKLDKEMERDGYKTSDAALNRVEYFRQKVITTDTNMRKDNTGLIAVYFPMLLENLDNMLASK
jgi:hypothetical protein